MINILTKIGKSVKTAMWGAGHKPRTGFATGCLIDLEGEVECLVDGVGYAPHRRL
jgi:hypothetical protein